MADARASVDIVVAKSCAHHFLNQPNFFVRATRRRNGTDTFLPKLLLNLPQTARCIGQRLIPGHLFPRLINRVPDHGFGHTVFVRRVAKGKAPLNAGVSFVGFAVFPRRHSNHFLTAHLGLESAAHAAVSTGSRDGVLGNALFNNTVLGQRRRRTGRNTRAAGDTVRL